MVETAEAANTKAMTRSGLSHPMPTCVPLSQHDRQQRRRRAGVTRGAGSLLSHSLITVTSFSIWFTRMRKTVAPRSEPRSMKLAQLEGDWPLLK